MDKKKVLLTSLATLSLVAAANPAFAEETTTAPVAEPTVAAEASPAVAEPSAETAPAVDEASVSTLATDDVPAAESTPAVDEATPPATEEVPAVAASSAGEVTPRAAETPAMDVQAIANGDYSSVAGEWVNDETGEVTTITPYPTLDEIAQDESGRVTVLRELVEGTHVVERTRSYMGQVDKSGRPMFVEGPGRFSVRVFIPQGVTASVGGTSYNAPQDTILDYFIDGNTANPFENVLTRQPAAPVVVEDTVAPTDEEVYASAITAAQSDGVLTSETTNPTYAFFDVNNDGQNELLIGRDSLLRAVYGVDANGETPQLWLDGLNLRIPPELREDGTIIKSVNNGSTLPISVLVYRPDETGFYSEVEGYELSREAGIYKNYKTGQTLTAEEFEAHIASPVVDLSVITWNALIDFVAPTVTETPVTTEQPTVDEPVVTEELSTTATEPTPVREETTPTVTETPVTTVEQPTVDEPVVTEELSTTTTESTPVKDVATIRNELLLDLDASALTDAQKSAYAEEIAAAETPEALAAAKLSIDRLVLLLDLDASKLTDAQKAVYAEEIAAAETPEALAAAKLSYERFALLLDLDASVLTDAQKSDLAEKIAAAETAKDLAALKAEFVALTKPAAEEAKTTATPVATRSEAPSKVQASQQAAPAKPSYSRVAANADKGFLPSTGEAASVLGLIGAGLSALGLAGIKRRR